MNEALVTTVVRSGPAIVVSSGQATSFAAHPLRVAVQMLDDSVYTLSFDCSVDPTVGEPEVSVQPEPWGVTFRLINFSDGRGSAEPVALGVIGEHRFYLHFRVFLYGQTADHTVHWTFFAVPV